MPRTNHPPKYRLQWARGSAVVTIDGKNHYLGRFGSPESHEKYARLIAQWTLERRQGTQRQTAKTSGSPSFSGTSINAVILAYWKYAQGYYRKNGQPTGETNNIRDALRPLRKLFGSTAAAAFTAEDLETARQHMIDANLSRNVINARVNRIKRMFRWAAKKKYVPPITSQGLNDLEPLKRGRFDVRETGPIQPVPIKHVRAILPHLTLQVQAMVRVQLLTGMRPQDIRNMRTCDITTSRDVWVYTPFTHKTEHHGHQRKIAIGPRAQQILRRFLKSDEPTAFVFSPREAATAVRAQRRRQRKTPLTPSQRARKPKTNPKRSPGDQYKKSSYETAIRRACTKAKVPHWSPNRLRHTCGTRVRRRFGFEAAAAVLGNGWARSPNDTRGGCLAGQSGS